MRIRARLSGRGSRLKQFVKFEVITAIASFALIFGAGLAGEAAVKAGMDFKTAQRLAQAAMLILFCFFGFALIGLMLHLFISLQIRIGNGVSPLIQLMAQHEKGLTIGVWCFLGVGALVALPFAFYDLGIRLPLRSKGVLVADIGMTIDEVKQRSSLPIKDPRHMGDGSRLGVADVIFDFRVGDSNVHFPLSRYYWIQTPRNDEHISVMNIGITPEKMPAADLDAFEHAAHSRLLADGWMPGHNVADSEETVRLWGGKRTTGEGRFWLRNNTVLIFERSRMDEEKTGEPPGSGEYIVALHIKPKAEARDVVFEPSAWNPSMK